MKRLLPLILITLLMACGNQKTGNLEDEIKSVIDGNKVEYVNTKASEKPYKLLNYSLENDGIVLELPTVTFMIKYIDIKHCSYNKDNKTLTLVRY